MPVTSSRPLPLIIATLLLKQGVLARYVHQEAAGLGVRGWGGINSAANKPPASCRGLGLLMWTEIEAGNLAVELDEVERTASGEKLPGITGRSVFTGAVAWLMSERLQAPTVSMHRP